MGEARDTPVPPELLADGLMTLKEAGAFARVGLTTLYWLTRTGRLASVKVGGRRRIPRRALVQLLAAGPVASARPPETPTGARR